MTNQQDGVRFLPRRPIPAFITKNDEGATVLRVTIDPYFSGGEYRYSDFTLAVSSDPMLRMRHTKALLHTLPRSFRVKEGLEAGALAAIESTLERRAWEGEQRPQSTKKARGCSERDRRKTYGVRAKAAQLFNHLWRQVVTESAHQEARAIALRFPPSNRWGVYQQCALSERFRQLCAAFPLLAAKLVTNDGFSSPETALLEDVERGRSLRDIASDALLPWHLRKLHPCCSVYLSQNPWPTAQMMQFCPQASLKQYRWLAAISKVIGYRTDTALVGWVAQRADLNLKIQALGFLVTCIRDWWLVEHPDQELRCSWDTAVERQARWHRDLEHRARVAAEQRDAEAARRALLPFPTPWLPCGEASGYSIVPLTSAAELLEEGAAMRHCVANYASWCHDGRCCIYGVRRGDERVATLELQREGAGYRIAQLHGPANGPVVPAVSSAVRTWMRRAKAAKAAKAHAVMQEAC